MAPTKTRLNISLSDDTKKAISKLASRDQVPDATLAARLIEIALELEEDQVWDKLAAQRAAQSVEYISHKNAWK